MNDERHDDRCDEHNLPCWVALVASSMALMSAHAAPEATRRSRCRFPWRRRCRCWQWGRISRTP